MEIYHKFAYQSRKPKYMPYTNLTTELNNSILKITINRPDQLNALNKETISELGDAMHQAERNEEVLVIVLTGSGQKAFVAGADIKEFQSFSVAEGKALSQNGHDALFNLMENLKKPIIAAINGFALGGGLELALAAHIRIASTNAKMGLPEVSLGLIPGYGGTQRLSHLVGKGMAFQLITSAQMIPAERAKEIGLVNEVVEQENLMITCEKLATKIMNNSPLAISSAMRAINASYKQGADGYAVEIEEFGKCFGTVDFKEGTSAFVEKRKANFSGN
jgi:enoyl-CoA hydratase